MLPGFRDIVTTVLARAVAMIGPLAVGIITARMLGPEDRGRYFLLFSIAQIAAQISNLGLHSSNTYLVANHPERLGPLAVNSIFLAAAITPVVAVVAVVAVMWPELAGLRGDLAIAGPVLLAPMLVAFLYLSNLAIGSGRTALFNGISIFMGVSTMAAAGLVAVAGGGTAQYLFAGAGAMLVASVACWMFLFPAARPPLRFDLTLFRTGVAFAFKAYLATMFGFFMTRVGVIVLQRQSDFGEVGQFSIATQITDALITIPGIIGLLLFPALLRADAEDRWPALWRAFWRLGLLMLLLVGASAFAMPWLTIIFGNAYEQAVPLGLAMLPTVLIVSLITVLSQYLAAEGFPWGQAQAWIVGFVVHAGLSFLLAGPYGGFGVAIALAISSLLVLIILLKLTFDTRPTPVSDHD